jgi:hypothetical protein
MVVSTAPKLKATIFYSWQSDLPSSTNRSLIQDALERAAKTIRADDSLAVEPVLDRDTQNVSGAPDIAQTIFQKIEKSTAFVADVTIINPGLGRPTPNPNVLLEAGYAFRALGSARTVLIFNTANGPIEALPFDLRMRRVLSYHLPPGSEDKPEQRKKLQTGLEMALRAILTNVATQSAVEAAPSPADSAIESIETGAASQGPLCAKVIPPIAKRVAELTPKLRREEIERWDDELVSAIQQTLPLVTDFARVADAAALHDSREGALGLFRGFAPLFTQYNYTSITGGSFYEVQFDLPKFVGHELMVTLFSALIAARRWDAVAALCRETVMVPNAGSRHPSETPVTYIFASEHLKLLDHRNDRLKSRRLSLHADLLQERHEAGELAYLCPWQSFQDADIFLFLRSALPPEKLDIWDIWRPWSAAILSRCPGFLREAVQREKAEALRKALGLQTVAVLRERLQERIVALHQLFGHKNPFFDPLPGLDPNRIGTA